MKNSILIVVAVVVILCIVAELAIQNDLATNPTHKAQYQYELTHSDSGIDDAICSIQRAKHSVSDYPIDPMFKDCFK